VTPTPQERWLKRIRDCETYELHPLLGDLWCARDLPETDRWSMASLIAERMADEGWYLDLQYLSPGLAEDLALHARTIAVTRSWTQYGIPHIRIRLVPHECGKEAR
jgi:hypothetical protein